MATLPPPATKPRRKKYLGPLLFGAALWIVALAALLQSSRGEAESRRSLTLRSGELIGWLTRDLATSNERPGFADEGGAADAAPVWRDVLSGVEEAVAITIAGPPRLPSLAADARLADSLRAAIGARRFTPFAQADEIVEDPWSRRACVFARLLANGCAEPADRGAWLEAAVAFASDLRAVGTLQYAVVAAQIDEAVAQRLAHDGPLDAAQAQRLADLVAAAQSRLPRPECIALRETRVLQTTICALADVAPLNGNRLRSENEPPLSMVSADDAVTRLDRLPGLMVALLGDGQDARARADWSAFGDDFARRLPAIAPLLPLAEAVATAAAASARLAAIERSTGGRTIHTTTR